MQGSLHLNRMRTQHAAHLCRLFELSAAAQKLLETIPATTPFLYALIAQRQWLDAVKLLAYGLRKRRAIWWACLICRDYIKTIIKSDPEKCRRELAVVLLAEIWVRDPQQQNRTNAYNAGLGVDTSSPVHWLASAVCCSAANLPRNPAEPVLSSHYIYARAICMVLECAAAHSEHGEDIYRQALRQGVCLAARNNDQRMRGRFCS